MSKSSISRNTLGQSIGKASEVCSGDPSSKANATKTSFFLRFYPIYLKQTNLSVSSVFNSIPLKQTNFSVSSVTSVFILKIS